MRYRFIDIRCELAIDEKVTCDQIVSLSHLGISMAKHDRIIDTMNNIDNWRKYQEAEFWSLSSDAIPIR